MTLGGRGVRTATTLVLDPFAPPSAMKRTIVNLSLSRARSLSPSSTDLRRVRRASKIDDGGTPGELTAVINMTSFLDRIAVLRT